MNATARSTQPSLNTHRDGRDADRSRNFNFTKTEVRESPELQEMWKTTNDFNAGRKTNENLFKHGNLMQNSPGIKHEDESLQENPPNIGHMTH